jgi:hypothetical protein
MQYEGMEQSSFQKEEGAVAARKNRLDFVSIVAVMLGSV